MVLPKKKRFELVFLFLLLFIDLTIVAADDLNVSNSSNISINLLINMTETGRIIKYYEQYYITRVTGSINFTNPSNTSELFKLSIPFVMPSGMTIVDTGTNLIKGNELVIENIKPLAFLNTTYKIVGISTTNPVKNNESVLMSAVTSRGDIKAYADLKWKLTKSDPSESLDTNGKITRLVVAEIYNPTDFSFRLEFLKIIKSNNMNPNDVIWIQNIVHPEDNSIIPPRIVYRRDIVDDNLTDTDIYWINLNLFLSGIQINSIQRVTFLTEANLTVLGEPTEISDGEIINASLLEENLFIRKFVSASVVNPGDLINVTILINNIDPINRRVQIYDVFPLGFDIIDNGEGKEQGNQTLLWNISVNPDSVYTITYTIKFTDENSIGIDYFEATRMVFQNNTFYSRTIPFIRRYVPESKAYIQKKLKYTSSGEVMVTIDIKNIGEDNLQNVILKEYLDKADMFREITKLPEGKGVWDISTIKPGETWTVSYITDENERNLILPVLFGLSQGNILQTLVMDTVIKYNFFLSSINYIEYVGITALITIPLALLILRNKKKIDYRFKLGKLETQIKGLLETTHTDFIANLPEIEKTKIDKLQKDLDDLKEVKPDKLSEEQKGKVANWLKSNQDYIDKLMKETKNK